MKTSAFLGIASLIAIGNLVAAEDHPAATKTPATAKNSLDGELLKSLDDKLLDTLGERLSRLAKERAEPDPAKPAANPTGSPPTDSATKPEKSAPAGERKTDDPLDDELRKSLGGEDLGSPGDDVGENQLTRIVREMRSVEERLAQSNSDSTTRKQQEEIAAELAALLDQLRKQQASHHKSGSKQPTGTSSSKPGQPKQAAGTSPAANPSSQPARDSSKDLRAARSERPGRLTIPELMEKALDGLKLPERDRQQMLDAASDEFLPGFEPAIKKYFERIVEEEGER